MTAPAQPQAVLEIGLTGGIGSGKSTVALLLIERGAVLVDADAIVRQLQAPGQAVYQSMVDRWGTKILDQHGAINRPALAEIVFNDQEELTALNDLVHPAVRKEMAAQRAEYASGKGPIILDIPLLVESGHDDLAHVLVVDVDPEIAVERLMKHRGFSEEDARNRVASQASREERKEKAGFIIDNSGDQASLAQQVDAAWEWILSLDS